MDKQSRAPSIPKMLDHSHTTHVEVAEWHDDATTLTLTLEGCTGGFGLACTADHMVVEAEPGKVRASATHMADGACPVCAAPSCARPVSFASFAPGPLSRSGLSPRSATGLLTRLHVPSENRGAGRAHCPRCSSLVQPAHVHGVQRGDRLVSVDGRVLESGRRISEV